MTVFFISIKFVCGIALSIESMILPTSKLREDMRLLIEINLEDNVLKF